MSSSGVTVIVLDLDGGERLLGCLDSIAKQDVACERVIVFDNGSTRPAASRLEARYPFTLDVQRSAENLGFTGGINAAMRSVATEYVAWVNNDVVLDRAWLGEMLALFEAKPQIAAAQSLIAGENGSIDGAGISIEHGRLLQRGHGEPLDRAPRDAPWGISATAALYRVSALRDVAFGDDVLHRSFFAYYEDVELSARLRERGFEFAYDPRPLATHGGSSTATRLGMRAERLRARNRYLVGKLHPRMLRVSAFVAEDVRIVLVRLLRLQFASAWARLIGAGAGILSPLPGRILKRER